MAVVNFQHKIAIDQSKLVQLKDTASDEFVVNANKEKPSEAKKLTGNWISVFEDKINEYEKLKFKMKGKVSFLKCH